MAALSYGLQGSSFVLLQAVCPLLAVPGQVRGKVRWPRCKVCWPLWAVQRLPIDQSPSSPSYFEVRVLPFPCGAPPPASFVKPDPGLPGGPGHCPSVLTWGYQGPPGCAGRLWHSCWCPTRGVAGRCVCLALQVVGLVLAPPSWARGQTHLPRQAAAREV